MDQPLIARAYLGDGREWRLGASRDVAWINEGTFASAAITTAIPPIFASYCTLELPGNYTAELVRHEQAVIELLTDQTPEQPWWLGSLDTGASDVVFPYAPRTTAYYGYGYVLVQAGPQQAASWRKEPFSTGRCLSCCSRPIGPGWSRPCGTMPGPPSVVPSSS